MLYLKHKELRPDIKESILGLSTFIVSATESLYSLGEIRPNFFQPTPPYSKMEIMVLLFCPPFICCQYSKDIAQEQPGEHPLTQQSPPLLLQ